MPKKSIYLGIFLILLGSVLFLITGTSGKTALIVSGGLGILFVVVGVIAIKRPSTRKHMMHVASLLALLATLGSLGRAVPGLFREISPLAIFGQFAVGISCLIFLVLCVKSFIDVRKKEKSE